MSSRRLPDIKLAQLHRLYQTRESPRKEDVDVREWKFDKKHKSWCQGMEKRLHDEKERSKRLELKAETKVASMIVKSRECERKLKEKRHQTEHRRQQAEEEHRDQLRVVYKEVHDRMASRTKSNINKLRHSVMSGLLVRRRVDFDPFKPTELERQVTGEIQQATSGDINMNSSMPLKRNCSVQAPGWTLPDLNRARRYSQPLPPTPTTNKLGRLRGKDGALMWTPLPAVTPNISEANCSNSTEDESVWIKPGHFRTILTQVT